MDERVRRRGARRRVAEGDVIADKYRVERVLGEGGMGMVVAATHIDLRRLRAIKLMLPEVSAVPMAAERFLREARAASSLTSEHVAHVFDIGQLDDGTPFMVMEYLEGYDLRDELSERGVIGVEEAVRFTLQVCDALAEAHAQGIVHRDLKPANLFLTVARDGSPRIKLLDFGISKLLDAQGSTAGDVSTVQGAVLGSPRYMSPEQIRGDRSLDGRCDIWSMGVILYELITGIPPFLGKDTMQVLAMVLEGAPVPPSQRIKGLPPELDEVILRCLEKEPTRRYRDVVAFAHALLPLASSDAAQLVERLDRAMVSSGVRAVEAPPSVGREPSSTLTLTVTEDEDDELSPVKEGG